MTATVPSLSPADVRTAQPLFTLAEASRYLGVHGETLRYWSRSDGGAPLITTLDQPRGHASVPFVGFAEAFVLAAFRRAGVPLQRIRPAVDILRERIGSDHALASRNLYTDGAEVLYRYAADHDDPALLELTVVRTGQRQFSELVRAYLQRITYGADDYAESVRLPAFGPVDVVVDPRRAFGQPFLARGGARVEDVVDRFYAGDSIAAIADDFAIEPADIEAVLRGATHVPAST